MDIIKTRRSVRKFDLSKKIDDKTLELLCSYGEAAPRARRQETREYVIINDKSIIDELSEFCKGTMQLKECNTVIAVIGKNPNTLAFPDMQMCDLAAATENILIAARSLNLGSCWIGISPLKDRIELANKALNLKDGKFVFSFIVLGYPMDLNSFDETKNLAPIITYNRM